MVNKKAKIIIILILFGILMHCNIVNAVEVSQVEYSEEYKQWLELPEEEKQNLIAPRMFDIDVNVGENKVFTKIKTLMNSVFNPRFDLRDTISSNLKIRNQGRTNSCWTFATLSSLETNLALNVNKNKIYDFSEKHMNYSSSQSFNDGKIKNGFSKEASQGGNFQIGAAYLTNGWGAVAEEDMPFTDSTENISIKDKKNKEVLTKVTDTEEFYFTKYMLNETIDSASLNALMLKMKEHIEDNGSISAGIHGTDLYEDCYNNETGAIYCSNEEKCQMNHNVSIIGWDDNYSIDNFSKSSKPNKNGAWIIRNSWGEEINGVKIGDDGFMYVSYEDVNIYKQLFGIEKATDNIDYDNIYQYNELGYNNALNLDVNKIYIANVFERDKTVQETLEEVSLNVLQNVKCKVYVNSKNGSKAYSDMEEIELKEGKTETFDAGYHTLEFKNPIQLTGDKFVVVIEIEAIDEDKIYCATISNTTNNFWDNVECIEKANYLTYGDFFEKNMWIDTVVDANNINTNPSNLTIKAFTRSVKEVATPTPTPTVTATPMPTETIKPTSTPTITPTVKPTQSVTSTPTIRPTSTPTIRPTQSPTQKPTTTPTQRPTSTIRPIQTPTSTIMPTTPIVTPTIVPTVAISNSNTVAGGVNTNSLNSGGTSVTENSSLPYAGKTEIIIGLIVLLSINIIIVYKKYKKIY